MRCFLAVELGEETRKALGALLAEAKSLNLDATFAKPDHLHCTLAFFPELSDEEFKQKAAALEGLSFPCFEFPVEGTGFFPSFSFVRVFWAGIKGHEFIEMQKKCAELLDYKSRKPFSPHITLARVKSQKNLAALKKLQQKNADAFFGKTRASELVFKKSVLTPSGPEYEDLARFKLV